jgi:hypothetical protein
MTDIETLRSALREPPAEEFAAPDIAGIMAKGKRIRRCRRLATGAGGVAAAAVTVLVIVGAVALREPRPQQPQSLPPAASAPVTSGPVASGPTTTEPPAAAPLGNVIPLGTVGRDGKELVLYAYPLDEPVLPDIRFGLRVASRNADGTYDGLLATNEFKGSDRSFGFHATDGGELIEETFIPVFGYFAGPAASITSTVRGKTVTAKTTVWSEDPNVVFFWFDQADVPSSDVLTPLIAYDAKGERLATVRPRPA